MIFLELIWILGLKEPLVAVGSSWKLCQNVAIILSLNQINYYLQYLLTKSY
jgi:hypothetical protein